MPTAAWPTRTSIGPPQTSSSLRRLRDSSVPSATRVQLTCTGTRGHFPAKGPVQKRARCALRFSTTKHARRLRHISTSVGTPLLHCAHSPVLRARLVTRLFVPIDTKPTLVAQLKSNARELATTA